MRALRTARILLNKCEVARLLSFGFILQNRRQRRRVVSASDSRSDAVKFEQKRTYLLELFLALSLS